MAERKTETTMPNGRPDFAAAILNSMDPIFSVPIYLMTIFFPHYRHAFSNRPWTKRLLSTALAGGFGALLIVKLVSRLWGQFLWDTLLYWTTTVAHIDTSDDLLLAFWWLYHNKRLLLRNNEHHLTSVTNLMNTSPADQLWIELASRGRNGGLMLLPLPVNQIFHYKGRNFSFNAAPRQDTCTIRCLGWSIKPIEDMLDDAYEGYRAALASRSIALYTPRARTEQWNSSVPVCSRSLESVEMDSQEKAALISDIGRYRASKDWYQRRGIPWRRGYLFHGPPGTGKTSLVTALAARFRLSVYAIAFSEWLTDSALQQLLRRLDNTDCIVLLEDIDSAGLIREGQDLDEIGSNEKTEVQLKSRRRSAVTLSGLLNAIDGIGAPEGHILILTSNYVERLDVALTRPGRVDYRLKFDLATKKQAQNIFLRLQASSNLVETRVNLEELAQTFADKIPEKVLSPAEIQDFLLHRREDPEKAVNEADDWIRGILAVKGEGQEEFVEADGGKDDRANGDEEPSEAGR